MRKSILLYVFLTSLFLTTTQCKKDTVDQLSLMPPATTTGANTFGCLSDGNALVAKDGKNLGAWCMVCGTTSVGVTTLYDNYDSIANALEINTSDSRGMEDNSPSGFYLKLHFVHLYKVIVGNCPWQNVQDFGSSGYYFNNYVEGEFYVDSLKGYAWFDSYNGSGKTNITRCDTNARIISGTFDGKMRIRNGTREISFTNGRFDVKW